MYNEKAAATVSLMLRIMLAGFFAYHFYWKVSKGLDFTVESFVQRGFPLPSVFTYLDVGSEIFVIPFLVLGIYSRFCMIAMTPLMIGVIGVVFPRGPVYAVGGYEFPLMWLMCMWILIVAGDGRFAVKVPHLFMDGRHPATWLKLGRRTQPQTA